jgi:hypothetical protein
MVVARAAPHRVGDAAERRRSTLPALLLADSRSFLASNPVSAMVTGSIGCRPLLPASPTGLSYHALAKLGSTGVEKSDALSSSLEAIMSGSNHPGASP